MNKRIEELEKQSYTEFMHEHGGTYQAFDKQKFAELIVRECAKLNKKQSYELTGVIVDTEEGDGFDHICLDTVKRVESYLASNTLMKYFGVEE